MYHPSRAGVRGGRDQFTRDEVKVDKHRENYIVHSLKDPVGRWQKERTRNLSFIFSMENHLHHQTKVLSMNISCCERCPYLLKKKLLKMPGVDSVAIDTENNLVYVVGYIDATTLLDKVAKLGKAVQLVPADKQPRNHADEKHNRTRNQGRGNNFTAPEKGKSHKNCCCEDGRHNTQKKVEEKDHHKCEAYVPPPIDSRVCRDFYCKTHPRGRVIVDKVPAESCTFFGMGQMPFHGSYGPYGGGSRRYPGWYGEEPQQFGYGWPSHPFGF